MSYDHLEGEIKNWPRATKIKWYLTMFPRPPFQFDISRKKWLRNLKDFLDGKFTVVGPGRPKVPRGVQYEHLIVDEEVIE